MSPWRGGPVRVVAQVVLHVAVAKEGLGVDVLEFLEDLAGALAQDVGQHVQPAAVRHADDDLVQPLLPGMLDGHVQQGDQGLGALQTEPFGTRDTCSG